MSQQEKIKKAYHCLYCDEPYRKQDYSLCPHCGGDGGGTTPKVWKPSKYEKKAYVKKMKLE